MPAVGDILIRLLGTPEADVLPEQLLCAELLLGAEEAASAPMDALA